LVASNGVNGRFKERLCCSIVLFLCSHFCCFVASFIPKLF
jgi:hypothetical protein